jgi:transcriptional regulator of acetoin/glycerol metabolism
LQAPSLDLGDGFLTLAEMEKRLIGATLARLKGNQSVAARKLGISRSTLWRKMKEYGLEA